MLTGLTPEQKDAAFLERLPSVCKEIVVLQRTMDSDFTQPIVTFDAAKRMLKRRRELTRHAERLWTPQKDGKLS